MRNGLPMKKVFAFAGILILLSACSKKNKETTCFDGVIKWHGNPAADGLGWVIQRGDSTNMRSYVPVELSNSYKKEGLNVAVCLEETDEKVACFCAQPMNKYRITSIKVR